MLEQEWLVGQVIVNSRFCLGEFNYVQLYHWREISQPGVCWQIFLNSTHTSIFIRIQSGHIITSRHERTTDSPKTSGDSTFTTQLMVLGHKKRTSLQSTITPKHKFKAFWKEFRTKPRPWIPRDPGSFFQNTNLNNLRFVSVIIHPNRSSSDVRWARIPRNFGWWISFPYLILRNRRPNVEWFNHSHLFCEKLPHSGETDKEGAVFGKTGGCRRIWAKPKRQEVCGPLR